MAMDKKKPDSIAVKLWMKNIWVRQASKAMLWAPSQKRQSMRGSVDMETTRSVMERRHKKRNIGLQRLHSALTTARTVTFPTIATTYMERRESQSRHAGISVLGCPSARRWQERDVKCWEEAWWLFLWFLSGLLKTKLPCRDDHNQMLKTQRFIISGRSLMTIVKNSLNSYSGLFKCLRFRLIKWVRTCQIIVFSEIHKDNNYIISYYLKDLCITLSLCFQ